MALRTNLGAKFGTIRNVRPVTDPWGIGVVILLERSDSVEHRDYLRKLQDENPVYRALEIASARGALLAMASSVDGSGVDLTRVRDHTVDEARRIEITSEQMRALQNDGVESVARRIKGWQNMLDQDTGQPIPCTEEAKAELLRSELWIERQLPYGERTMGQALCAWLNEESDKHAEYREAVVDQSGKASGPTSDGSTPTPLPSESTT